MRTSSIRLAVVAALALGASGCATSFRSAAPDPPPTADAEPAGASPAEAEGPARVGLAATMDIPDNPYGDTAEVAIPDPSAIEAGVVPFGELADASDIDASDITVSRYYYGDEGTLYYEDVAADLQDDGQGYDDEVYYGGYDASYYRYADPAFYPSPYRYYRPYRIYRPYAQFGWYRTWNRRFIAF
ncbi:MAG: hypothetical protein AAGK21_08175, partial [Bacteroidota bacterium]